MKVKYLFLLGLAAAFSLLQTACEKEVNGCTNSLAENYDSDATDDDGSCQFARDQFLGTYAASQTCVYEDDTTFTLVVSQGPTENEVILENFYGWDIDLLATVNGNNISYSDTKQGVVFEGDGYLVNGELTLDFEVCEAFYYPCSDPDYCAIKGMKQ